MYSYKFEIVYVAFNLAIAERPEHSNKALLSQPEVTDGV